MLKNKKERENIKEKDSKISRLKRVTYIRSKVKEVKKNKTKYKTIDARKIKTPWFGDSKKVK
jgi:hypothetical protein